MEPLTAGGGVHRPGQDQQRPRKKPLRHIGTGRHGDTGTGVDRDVPGPADSGQQIVEIGGGVDVGEFGGMLAGERFDGGGQQVEVLDGDVRIGAVAQDFAHQEASTA